MAVTAITGDLSVDIWQRKFFAEYVRANRFARYMGMNENSIIQLIMDLTKDQGDDVWMALVTKLSGNGVTGDNTLEGNEEALSNYGCKITIDQLRNAVAVGRMQRKKAAIDLLSGAKMMLKLWAMDTLRNTIIARMLSPNTDGVTAYASCTEAQKDAWHDANYDGSSDRILFGAAKSNVSTAAPAGGATYDHSGGLANVDATNDTLVRGLVSLARRMARDSSPAIRPVRIGEDEEWYVLFANKWAFRDLKADLETLHSNGMPRAKSNPLWNDGDLVWDGTIIREVPEIGVISGVGAAGINVAPNFLCGAQAVGVAWGEKTHAIQDKRDYNNITGIGVGEIRGVKKATFNNIQHGMLTLYTAGVADT